MRTKAFFAPLPMRAMACELSGLQLRVLACVAAHDRMSLLSGKGQGCRASNERMKEMVGCSYPKLCSALSELVSLDFLQREKLGRHTVYRVIYTDDDISLFGNMSGSATRSQTGSHAPAIGNQSDSQSPETCNRDFSETRRKPPKTAQQYIPLNGGIHSVETGEDNTLKVRDAFASRGLSDDAGSDAGVTPHAQMARFERLWKSERDRLDRHTIEQWQAWLSELLDEYAEDEAALGRAQRLLDQIDYHLWETSPQADDAA